MGITGDIIAASMIVASVWMSLRAIADVRERTRELAQMDEQIREWADKLNDHERLSRC